VSALQIAGLRKQYGSVTALAGVGLGSVGVVAVLGFRARDL
jgi:hypothetical protein